MIICVTDVLPRCRAAVIGVSQRSSKEDGFGDSARLATPSAPGVAIRRPCKTGMRHTAEIEGIETDGLKTLKVLGGATIAP